MLVPALLHRFASDEGYDAQPNLVPALRAMHRPRALQGFDRVVVGVVTNSDDRVPDILSSFGLDISPLRYGSEDRELGDWHPESVYDIDFHCMSYDVGFEKPDVRIFHAAESMLTRIITARNGGTSPTPPELESWSKVYVGDEHSKDVVGSRSAGWHPVLLDAARKASDVTSLEDCDGQSVADVFQRHPVVQTRSIRDLALWLAGPEWESS